jgi:hypothetical protein
LLKDDDHRGSIAALNNLGLIFKATQDYAQAIFSQRKQAGVGLKFARSIRGNTEFTKKTGNAYYAISLETAIRSLQKRTTRFSPIDARIRAGNFGFSSISSIATYSLLETHWGD